MLQPLDDKALRMLLRVFFRAYQRRFESLAGEEEAARPVLAQQALELVRVNGGRALHFFFTAPTAGTIGPSGGVTRVHDVALWPADTEDLKAREAEDPDAVREQVRVTAEIPAEVYVHFVVYPEDGHTMAILEDVGARVAEREVRGGPPVAGDNGDGGEASDDPTGSWFKPAP